MSCGKYKINFENQLIDLTKQLSKIKKHLKCLKCKNLPQNPYRVILCGHKFCKSCIESKNECPFCQKKFISEKDVLIDHNTTDKINALFKIENLLHTTFNGTPRSTIIKENISEFNKTESETNQSHKESIHNDIECIWIPSKSEYVLSRKKKNKVGESKLHVACIKGGGDIEAVKKFIEMYKDVNIPDNFGWTPLHEAVKGGNFEIVEMLIKAGAIVNAPSNSYDTPLHMAASIENEKMMDLLIKYGAKIDAINYQGKTANDIFMKKGCHLTTKMISPFKKNPIVITSAMNFDVRLLPKVNYNYNITSTTLNDGTIIKVSSDIKSNVLLVPEKALFPERCLFTLQAIVQGVWILTEKWFLDSSNSSKFINPVGYEVTGTQDYPNSNTPMKARLSRQLLSPGLFHGCNFYIHGTKYYDPNGEMYTRENIIQLIQLGDGKILKRKPDVENLIDLYPYHAKGKLKTCSNFIIFMDTPLMPEYRFTQLHTLSVKWLLHCIETFQLDFESELNK